MRDTITDKDDIEKIHWFVMSAYKNERKAEEKLSGKDGLEYFIPKQYAVRVYHGVKSKRLVPVIPSLIFVHASQKQITAFKKLHNFIQFVVWKKSTGQEYLTVPDEQMDNFIKIASWHEETTVYYKPEEIDIQRGTRVRIHGGPFDGVEGVFVKVKGKRNRRVVVMLEGVMAVAAEVHPDLIEVLKKK
jgi:transcription antitermination factor NusG